MGAFLVDERRRLTRIPNSILVQVLSLAENPSEMDVIVDEGTYRVLSKLVRYSDFMSVRVFRAMSISGNHVLIDSWDLEWVKNPERAED